MLLEHRCVSLLVQESLVHRSLSLNGCGAFLTDGCYLLVFLELCQYLSLLLDQISVGKWEVVHAVQSAVALLLFLSLFLLISQHAVRKVESFSLQVAIQGLVVDFLEQLLSLDLQQVLLVPLYCVDLVLFAIFFLLDLALNLSEEVVVVGSVKHHFFRESLPHFAFAHSCQVRVRETLVFISG